MPTTDTFPADSAVERVEERLYRATVTPGYSVVEGAPNGGFIAAIGARALADALPHPDPVTLTTHFLAPPHEGPVLIEVEVLRAGGRHSTAVARMLQGEREVLHVTGTFTDLAGLAERGAPSLLLAGPPELPAPEACAAVGPEAPEGAFRAPPIFARMEHRLHPDDVGWTVGRPSGAMRIRGWSRPLGGATATPLHLLLLADSYPPVIFDAGVPVAWAPTLELTVQVRRHPAPGWLRVVTSGRFLTDGYFEEDAEIWDAEDHLVALSRQLALAGTGRS